MNYVESLQYLMERLPMFQRIGQQAFKKDLTNTMKLLAILDNPHQKFKSIHIAGTNGKGSSAHAIASVLQSAGYSTGLYTSPHLKSFTERIRINGEEVSESFVVEFVEVLRPHIEKIKPSFFEVTVAMAFQYFAEKQVDIAVIETGLGGRLDSTNVITPLLSLITSIGYDHVDILGDTLEQIAGEKAGIIKPEVPLVIGSTQRELYQVFANKAVELKSPVFYAEGIRCNRTGSDQDYQYFQVTDREGSYPIKSDLQAAYFEKNLPGILKSLEVLQLLGFQLSNEQIQAGIAQLVKQTGLKGRWQILDRKPFIVADISHNIDGIAILLKQVSLSNHSKLHIVIGMVKDKDVHKVLELLPTDATYYFTQASVPRSMNSDELQKLAEDMGLIGQYFVDVNDAIDAAKKNAEQDDFILITGSTFVVAEIEGL